MRARALALAVTILLPLAGLTAAGPARTPQDGSAPGAQRINADAKVMADFEARVAAYSALHRKLEATLPALSKDATPEQINAHQTALAGLIAKARNGAEPGDIFFKESRALFRRYLNKVFEGPRGRSLKAAILDDKPGKLRLHINGPYPQAIPVASVPPQVLQELPKLPEDLEYRFIGDRLVLHDIHANTIADLIDDAIRD